MRGGALASEGLSHLCMTEEQEGGQQRRPSPLLLPSGLPQIPPLAEPTAHQRAWVLGRFSTKAQLKFFFKSNASADYRWHQKSCCQLELVRN